MQKADAPVTQRDLKSLMIKLSDISDTLGKMELEQAKQNKKSRITR